MSSLAGCSIAIVGRFPGCTHAKLRSIVVENGGKSDGSVNAGVTHLVSAAASVGVAATVANVKVEWLLDCVAQGKRVGEDGYLWESGEGQGIVVPARATAGVKVELDVGEKEGVLAQAVKHEESKEVGMPDVPKQLRKRARAAKNADEAIKEENSVKRQRGRAEKVKAETGDQLVANGQSSKTDGAGPSAQPKPKKLAVPPVDPYCPVAGSYHVYADSATNTVFDASLNQTNISANNNKFYLVQLLESDDGNSNNRYATFTRWGRVGEAGSWSTQYASEIAGARVFFEKKFRDKSGLAWANRYDTPKAKKYVMIEKHYVDEDEEEEMTDPTEKPKEKPKPQIHPQLQTLMELIFNKSTMERTMSTLRYDANKLPLGKLSKKTLSQGLQALKDISEVLTIKCNQHTVLDKYGKTWIQVLGDLSSAYYTIIPHDFGRGRPDIITTDEALLREISLVESLDGMEIATGLMKEAEYPTDETGNPIHPLDSQFKSLNLEQAIPLDKSTTEYQELNSLFAKNHMGSARATVLNIFRISRPGETTRFLRDPPMSTQQDTRKLLWHGSRVTNFAGILSQGLRIAPPEAPVNGYAFGKGIYLADLASKSLSYSSLYLSGGQGLMLLCEAQLGNPVYETRDWDHRAAEIVKSRGLLSTKAVGGTAPKGWKDAGVICGELEGVKMPDGDMGIQNRNSSGYSVPANEYIVYSIEQVKLRYLFQVHESN